MSQAWRWIASLSIAISAAAISAESSDLPKDWSLTGSNPAAYEAGIDRTTVYDGAASAVLAARSETPAGFAALVQATKADHYLGQRVRFIAGVKAQSVKDWTGLWLRIDDADGHVLAFDNMRISKRPIAGTQDWQAYSVVLNVPPNAAALLYGVVLSGAGRVWLDGAQVEIVDQNVEVTASSGIAGTRVARPSTQLPSTPRNMNFEQ